MSEFPKAVGYERGSPMFKKDDIRAYMVNQIKTTNFFQARAKDMEQDIDIANKKIDSNIENLDKNINRLIAKEKDFIGNAKRISSGIRKNSESLASGIGRIKTAADFDELERYTNVLERFVTALNELDVIEGKGKLSKIVGALK